MVPGWSQRGAYAWPRTHRPETKTIGAYWHDPYVDVTTGTWCAQEIVRPRSQSQYSDAPASPFFRPQNTPIYSRTLDISTLSVQCRFVQSSFQHNPNHTMDCARCPNKSKYVQDGIHVCDRCFQSQTAAMTCLHCHARRTPQPSALLMSCPCYDDHQDSSEDYWESDALSDRLDDDDNNDDD